MINNITNAIPATNLDLSLKENDLKHAIKRGAHHLASEIQKLKNEIASGSISPKEAHVILESIFANVRTYGMVGLWSLSTAEMRNISSTQEVQQSLMNLEMGVEQLSVDWSNTFTKTLADEAKHIQDLAANPNKWSDQKLAAEISAATTQYNFDSTNMQTFSSFYSSQNNLLSNGVSNAGQNLSTDGATIQQVVMKIMDSLSQILGSI